MFFPFGRRSKKAQYKSKLFHYRPTIETLEGRLVPATGIIAGTVFLDTNSDGIQNPGEQGLSGRVVYRDLNNDQTLDAGEGNVTTDANGNYKFELAAGEYTVRLEPLPNETATTPVNGRYNVSLSEGYVALGRDFGALPTNPAVPLADQLTTAFPKGLSDNETFVNSVYRNILGRDADAVGLAFWVSKLPTASALSDVHEQARLSIASQIWNSVEHRNLQVESYYTDLLHRPSDPVGKQIWVKSLLGGMEEATVIQSFLNSAEYHLQHGSDVAFVTGLYQEILGRTPDVPGFNHWIQALQNGTPRSAVINSIVFSDESLKRLVNSYYSVFLNRPADSGGTTAWLAPLKNRTLNMDDVANRFLASDENYSAGAAGVGSQSSVANVPYMETYNPSNNPNDVVWSNPAVVALNKLITITNNSNETVFPFFRDVNNGLYKSVPGQNYDSKDPFNHEYRGYLGYYDAEIQKHLFGLMPQKSITVNIPLVFWDGARIGFSTESTFITNQLAVGENNINNPYQYYKYERGGKSSGNETLRLIVDDPSIVSGNNGDKPAVMWYHSVEPFAPTSEAPDQLLELTIRDPIQYQLNANLPNPATNGDYLGPLFNYDVSFVDSLMHSAALEAPAVKVPNESGNAPFGWVGAPIALEQFQQYIQNFTSDDPIKNGLGQYFDGRGWNSFFVPDANMGIKIPATKNIFELSPLNLGISTYRTADGSNPTGTLHHILSSGGNWYQQDTQSSGNVTAGNNTITGVKTEVIKTLTQGMVINNPNLFLPGTSITNLGTDSIELSSNAIMSQNQTPPFAFTFVGSQYNDLSGNATGSTLTLANPAQAYNLKPDMIVSGDGIGAETRIQSIAADGTITLNKSVLGGSHTYTFQGAISDYAAEKLLGLWYAWSDYYVKHITNAVPSPFVGNIAGNLTSGHRELHLNTTVNIANLYPGMAVSGNGITSNTVISSVDTGNGIINLSTVALSDQASTNFSFALPQPIIRSSDVPATTLDFSPAETAKAVQFSQVLYSVMQAFSTIPRETSKSTSLEILANIIGGNVTKIPNHGPDTGPIPLEIRDQSKSLERGVYDFKAVSETTGEWYPDPSVATSGAMYNGEPAKFNVYNLDPYVWFVHKRLGVSGYAFSLDDDTADVGATNSTSLHVTIGGLGGLTNTAEWSPGAPFGPVTGTGNAVIGVGNAADAIRGLPTSLLNRLVSPNVADGVLGALVLGAGVQPGTRVAGFDLGNSGIVLDTKLGSATLQPAPYGFFGAVHATGTIDPTNPSTNTTISKIDTYSLQTLAKITANNTIPLGALSVTGLGVKKDTRVLSIDFTNATVTLSNALESTTLPGEYRFKFS